MAGVNSQLLADLHTLRSLVDLPEKWTKNMIHFDINGIPLSYRTEAGRYCVPLAVHAIADGDKPRGRALWNALQGHVHWRHDSLLHWHDHPNTTHRDVMSVIDLAIMFSK
ncbi:MULTISPECIES: hypothetical protein [unclassified Beijerinckia]|uniref:DUF6197 family protein n=1 Tax=unclassified Beijerinckia TaxID=2638183 RepID=UPI00089922BD|nr:MULTISPECIES: hypothetical protein [unclassified Beijerinckia]MDH7796404.1 hypothetical protein [Beijerinckia sp. GAS462]SEC43670.1 hypothetical protein SAMN05443249_2686 [Beijerinckia sp. 28-YEA-48]